MPTTVTTLTGALRQLRLPLTEQQVREHVLQPPSLSAARSTHSALPTRQRRPLIPSPRHVHTFDVAGFANALHQDLADSVAGYAMRVQQGASTVYTLEWNWAREPQDGGIGWTPQRRMHIASCSKLVTGIAMTKLFDEYGVSPDAKIVGYLPAYWVKGPGVDQVTFRQLLTHRSGFHYGQDETPSDYVFMRKQVAAGPTNVGTDDYQNMNYGLCRILLSTVTGRIPTDFAMNIPMPPLWDCLWDLATIDVYKGYCASRVFGPGNVTDASLAHIDGDALAYPYPVTGNGLNTGDISNAAGGTGWHLTVDDLLSIMRTFRREGTIVSAAQAQTALDASFGVDGSGSTPLGPYYVKNGGWGDGAGRTEQCVAFFFPHDTECVVFVNSPIGSPGASLTDLVATHYVDNVK